MRVDYPKCQVQRIGRLRHHLLLDGKRICLTDAGIIVDFWKRLGAQQIEDAESVKRDGIRK